MTETRDIDALRQYLGLIDSMIPEMAKMKSPLEVIQLKEFSQIVAMGKPALILMLDEIREHDGAPTYHLCQMVMINYIAERLDIEPPQIPDEYYGLFLPIVNEYLRWAEKNSFLIYKNQEA